MGEISIDPKFNIHETYKKVRILNPYRHTAAPAQGSYLLDTYPAAVAWSLRKLSGGYTGAAIRVRRSSDDLEQDIGFDSNGELDTAALLSFVGAGDGFVSTFYDQAGAGFNFTQTSNNSKHGFIVNSGVVNTLNGKPVILRSINDNGGYISDYQPNDGVTVKGFFYVGSNNNQTGTIFGSLQGGSDYGYVARSVSGSNNVNGNISLSNEKLNGATWTYTYRGDVYTDTINQFLLSIEIDFNFESTGLVLGYRYTAPSKFGMYSFQEMIIFANTTDHLDKETKINSYYAIY